MLSELQLSTMFPSSNVTIPTWQMLARLEFAVSKSMATNLSDIVFLPRHF
ncbi:hypothetical protein PUN4_780052 [Paraburkholderia unamae]|nr:hypothetical protein PUN4_780052 [Paraburkholderia unamae]